MRLDYWAGRGSSGQSTAPKSRLRLVVLPILLLLPGCFTSSQPKFSPASAVAVFGNGGRYIAYERRSDGSFARDETFELRKRTGGYDYIDDKGKATPISLHSIGPDLYVVQAMREDGRGVDYLVLRVRGNEALTYAADCTKQDAGKLRGPGVEFRDNGRICVIDNVGDPAALFATLKLGDPTGKMVRE